MLTEYTLCSFSVNNHPVLSTKCYQYAILKIASSRISMFQLLVLLK